MNNITWKVKAGLMVAAILALIQFVWVPFDEWQTAELDQLESLIRNIQKKKALVGQDQMLSDALKNGKNALQGTMKYYYSDISDAQALQLALQKDIERISAAHRVKINNTEWQFAVESGLIQAPIKVTCEGEPADILRFIHAIESGDRFIAVNTIRLLMAGKTSRIGMVADISAFGLKERWQDG